MSNRNSTGHTTGSDNLMTSDGAFNYQHDADGNTTVRTRIADASATAGGHFDANTGLVNDYHRWYNPATGDPDGFPAGNANLERYAANAPIGNADPTGLQGEPQGSYPGRRVPSGRFSRSYAIRR